MLRFKQMTMNASSVLSLCTVLLLACVASGATNGTCDLVCHSNSTCVAGSANFSDHVLDDGQPMDIHKDVISPNGYHCACPEGLTGLTCGRDFIGCEESDHECYYGGKCIHGLTDRYGNEQEFCDCRDAVDDMNLTYVGKYCEIPVPEPCGGDKSVFCVNGGTCRDDFEDHPHRPCDCQDDYEGPHCEYTKEAVPKCHLQCDNGGACQLGFKDYEEAFAEYQNYWKDNFNQTLMHCLCPDGFFGSLCEVSSTTCNNKICFNGGVCSMVADHNGTFVERCDCSTAGGSNKTFSGKYCQYQATELCGNEEKTDSGNATFCVNGGTCKNNDSDLKCNCPDGFHGSLCEFSKSETYTGCSLECDNGGICNTGIKNYASLNNHGFDMSALEHITNQTHTDKIEHCICPVKWTGVKCEIQVEKCGEDEHVCLHGSTCQENGNNYTCDCEEAFNGLDQFGGKYCEHKSTSICTPDNKSGTGKNKFAFCVNAGTCKKIVDENEEHEGCDCPAGFSGDHCEIKTETADELIHDSNTSSQGSSGASPVAIVFIVLAALVATVAAAHFYRRNKDGIEKSDPQVEESPIGHSSPPAPRFVEGGDLEGPNNLENVEII